MIGVTTFVHGWYQDYIPLYIHSILHAYPEYYPKVFSYEKLSSNVRESLNIIRAEVSSNFTVKENFFSEVRQSSDVSKKLYYLRWLLPYSELAEFEWVFICDVDLLMLREDFPLHRQRIENLQCLQLPFSNYLRNPKRGYPERFTGWHFIQTSEYYRAVQPEIDKIFADPYFDISNYPSYRYDNGLGEKQWGQEALLYRIISRTIPYQEKAVRQKNNCFATHHGLHLGPIRSNKHELLLLNKSTAVKHFGLNAKYWHMNDRIQNLLLNGTFKKLVSRISSEKAKLVVERLYKTYLDEVPFL